MTPGQIFTTGENEKQLKLLECKNSTGKAQGSLTHIDTHSGKKLYKFKLNLNAHIRHHLGEKVKPYKCPHCEYKFAQKNDLNRHLLTHLGEKPHKCPHCDHKSTQKGNLNTHILTHFSEKPYKCPHCEHRSTQKGNLNTHILTHFSEKPKPKPYKCHHCNFKCGAKRDLKRHLFIHYRCIRKSQLNAHSEN